MMMKKINEMVNGKKTEVEKNQEELSLNDGTLQELHSELAKFGTVKKGLEIELSLGEDSSLSKRFKKVDSKVKEIESQIDSLEARQAELNQAIAEENARQKQEKIDKASKDFEELVYLAHKRRLFEQEAERLNNWLYGKTGNAIYNNDFKRLAGVGRDESLDPQEHAPFVEAQTKASFAGTEKARKEFEKLLAQINEFLEK